MTKLSAISDAQAAYAAGSKVYWETITSDLILVKCNGEIGDHPDRPYWLDDSAQVRANLEEAVNVIAGACNALEEDPNWDGMVCAYRTTPLRELVDAERERIR